MKEKNLLPAPFVLSSRQHFIEIAKENRRRFEEKFTKLSTSSQSTTMTYVGTEKHYSVAPLESLQLITLRNMYVRKIHRGNYFLCRIIVPPKRVVAIEIPVEDPNGDVASLSLYNFPTMMNSGPHELDSVFPVGTILAIREPFLKQSLVYNSVQFMRVDSPTDVIFMDVNDHNLQDVTWRSGQQVPNMPIRPSTVCGWKEKGDNHFRLKYWLAAAMSYTKGLILDNSAILLKANRAEAYLKLGYFSAAKRDADDVLASPETEAMEVKALSRAGRAAYYVKKFDEALVYFQKMLAIKEDNPVAKGWIRRTQTRLEEQTLGRYDWPRIFRDSQKLASLSDIASFVGPVKVTTLPSRGGGRGIVATRNIEIGELLLVAKPFASAFKEDLSPFESTLAINFLTRRGSGQCSFATIWRTIEKIYGNPELHNQVFHLCPRPPFEPASTEYPPQTSHNIHHHPLQPSIDIDIPLLESMCSNNMFSLESLGYMDFKSPWTSADQDVDLPCALYLLPSLFNHSCVPNGTRTFFRNVMVVRAAVPIHQDEEIFLGYISEMNVRKRDEKLSQYGFHCTCPLCEDDWKDGESVTQSREDLMKKIKANAGNLRISPSAGVFESKVRRVETLIQQISATYLPTRRTPRTILMMAHHFLVNELQKRAETMQERLRHRRAISEEIKAIEAGGIHVIDKTITGKTGPRHCLPISQNSGQGSGLVRMLMMIVASFVSLNDDVRMERWLRAAWWLEDVNVGGGRELFEERYKGILGDTGISHISNKIPTTRK
ncbi:hypothetical protein BU17DRAFT_42595 [Hysterangium stoloniferum]|nr:hypothetical protein BU17DRAFT_42595 [Hysterangium stoloniferum]